MKVLQSALIGAALFGAAPAMAATIVDANAGEACKITFTGDFICRWTADDGSVSTATGKTDPYVHKKTMYAGVRLAPGSTLAAAGRIEFDVPYSLDTWILPASTPIFYQTGLSGWLWTGPNEVTGTAAFSSSFTGILGVNDGLPHQANLQASPTNYDLMALLQEEFVDRYCCNVVSSGSWQASLEWSFSTETQVYGWLDASTSISNIPEPATWAMFIAGFGLVGTAARCRRAAAA